MANKLNGWKFVDFLDIKKKIGGLSVSIAPCYLGRGVHSHHRFHTIIKRGRTLVLELIVVADVEINNDEESEWQIDWAKLTQLVEQAVIDQSIFNGGGVVALGKK